MIQDIFIKKKVILNGKDFQGYDVEGYEIGKEYEVDEIRIINSQVQIFLKGNIHAYPLQSFSQKPKKLTNEELIKRQKQETQRDLQTVITLLEGSTDRQKIADFIKEYLFTN